MTTSVSGSKKRGFAGLFGRKKEQQTVQPTAKQQLDGAQVAKLFEKSSLPVPDLKPGALQLSEIHDRNEISTLRGALYSGK
jgi:hypothetical protein